MTRIISKKKHFKYFYFDNTDGHLFNSENFANWDETMQAWRKMSRGPLDFYTADGAVKVFCEFLMTASFCMLTTEIFDWDWDDSTRLATSVLWSTWIFFFGFVLWEYMWDLMKRICENAAPHKSQMWSVKS